MQSKFAPFENRLTDAIEHLIDLRECYFDPERFRRTLNAAIEALRNVTFVLQKCGSKVEKFDEWYKFQQSELRADKILKWLVDSRNKVVKEGDLETHSTARIRIYRDWFEPPITTTEVSPNLSPAQYASMLSKVIPITIQEALLYVERRWVDTEFPETEIIELLDHCAEKLIKIADALSTDFEVTLGTQLTSTVERWKKTSTDFRSCWLKLKDRQVIDSEFTKIEPDESLIQNMKEAYDRENEDVSTVPLHTHFQKKCGAFFQQALAILRKDKVHLPIAVLILKNGQGQILGIPMGDRAEKHMQMRWLAKQVSQIPDPYAVIFINEAWLAFPKAPPCSHAVNYTERREALILHGVTCEGEFFNLCQFFERAGDQIWFPEAPVSSTDLPNIMRPVYNNLVQRQEYRS